MLQVKKGDTKPDLVFYDVRGPDGGLIDLTDMEVRVVCRRRSAFLFDRVVAGGVGTATMLWQPADTDVVGRLKFELKVKDGEQEFTIPSEGHFDVEVTQDLDQ